MKNIFRLATIFILLFVIASPASASIKACLACNASCGGSGSGPAGTINVNYTFTGAPGTSALVFNIGNITAALLDFTIPKGDTGPMGPAGADGATGATGPQGVNGTPGEPGAQGIQGVPGPQGYNGTDGAPGTPGANGLNGQNASVEINATFTLLNSSPASVTNIGNTTNVNLNFGIPIGPTGPKGDTGSPGSPGSPGTNGLNGQNASVEINATFTLPNSSPASVTNIGNTTNAKLNFGIPIGPTGPKGDTGSPGSPGSPGANGQNASVNINATFTLPNSSPASVTNIGNTTDVNLNFGIPIGIMGPIGPTGPTGPTGPSGANGTSQLANGNVTEVMYNIGGNSTGSPCMTYNNATGELTACFLKSNGDLSVGSNIYRGGAKNDSYLKIQAGENMDSAGAQMLFIGKNYTTESFRGDIFFRVPNLTTDGYITVIYIDDNTNNPLISFEGRNISKVGAPQVSTDAATKGYADSVGGGGDTSGFFMSNLTRPITGFEMNRSNASWYLAIDGGLGGAAGGATGGHFTLTGKDYSAFPGGLKWFVPNAANTSYLETMNIQGSTNSPFLNMLSHNIAGVYKIYGDPSPDGYGGSLYLGNISGSASDAFALEAWHILPSPGRDKMISVPTGTSSSDLYVSMNSHRIGNVTNPLYAQDVATKAYADSLAGGGADMTWNGSYPLLNGGRVYRGKMDMGGFNISNSTSSLGGDLVNKTYVDALTPSSANQTLITSSEFFDPTTDAIPGFLGAAVSSGTVAAVTSDANHPGVIAMRDSTTALGGYRYGCAGTQTISGGENFEITFRPNGVRTGQRSQMGWSDTSAAGVLPVDGIFFNVSGTGAALRLGGNTSSNSARSGTTTTYTPASGTWYRGTINVNSAASLATFTLYSESGGQLWTESISTNIPNSSGRETSPCIIVSEYTTDAAADIVWLDYVKWSVNRVLKR